MEFFKHPYKSYRRLGYFAEESRATDPSSFPELEQGSVENCLNENNKNSWCFKNEQEALTILCVLN